MCDVPSLVKRLNDCPSGSSSWKEFEDVCIEILTLLFVPPLINPKIQPRTYSGIDRRDAVFPNREDIGDSSWAKIRRELGARMILFEFKNYDTCDISKDEVIQTRSYLTKPMGKLAVLCTNKKPDVNAHIKRNSIFSDDGTVILFITKEKLEEMLYIKDRGEDPADLILDEIELFYLQHE